MEKKQKINDKESISQLALFGGLPLFSIPLHVGRPNIGDREKLFRRINDMLDRRWLSNNGPYVQDLEIALAKHLGVKYFVLVNNATIALEIGARALGFSGEVIIPSFTFIATAHALQWLGITPVFCDIDPDTHNIDPEKIESLVTSQTTGILGVHVWGRGTNMEYLKEFAKEKHLGLMFDAAHAFGCSYKGTMIGNFGDLEVFSFHATKFFNTFEGGGIATNNEVLAMKAKQLRNFGFTGVGLVSGVGTNGKMSEISAAMGLTSLESIDYFIKVNKKNYLAYQKGLANVPGIKIVKYNLDEKNNFQYIVIEIDEKLAGISRDLILKILRMENVLARRYFFPGCHQMEPYKTLYSQSGTFLPETEKIVRKVIQLPTGTSVSVQDISYICKLIRFTVGSGKQVSEKYNSLFEK